MTTRLVERLEREIAQCEDPFERECLKAQHAAVIARLGQLDHAKFILSGLKTQARRHGKPGLQAWVHFVRGSIAFFSEVLSADAREGFETAARLAKEAGDSQLQALAEAWTSAVLIQYSRDAGLFGPLSLAMTLAEPKDHTAWSRAWLVVADAADYAGLTAEAMRYYEEARRHAASDGDSTMVSLIMCNRANSLVSHHARRELFGTTVQSSLNRALSEIESTRNLDMGLGNSALESSVPSILAEALMLDGRWADSIKLADVNLNRQIAIGGVSFSARQLTCRSWCHAKLSNAEAAILDANAAVAGLQHVSEPDDLGVVHGRLARTFALLDNPKLVATHEAAATRAHKAHVRQEKEFSKVFGRFKQEMQKAGVLWPQD